MLVARCEGRWCMNPPRPAEETGAKLRPHSTEPLHLIVDSTGLEIAGAGEWSTTRHGRKRRCWRKLHLGVNAEGEIIAQILTDMDTDDSTALPDLLEQVQAPVHRFTGDGSFDRRPVYQAVGNAGTPDVVQVIPPSRRSAISEEREIRTWDQRNQAINRISETRRRDWQRESGFRQQARVENSFLRFEHILGPRIRSRGRSPQEREVLLGCHLSNRMWDLGRPKSEAMAAT